MSWEKVDLNKISSVESGNSAPQKKEHFVEGNIPFFRTSDVANKHITNNLINSRDFLNISAIEDLSMKLFPKNTILFPKSGASTFLNHRAIMGVDGYVSSHLSAIIPNSSLVIPSYLFYFLCTIRAEHITNSNDYPSLRLTDIEKINIPIPSLSEQKKIVEILEQADDLRNKKKEVIEKSDKIITSLFYKMFGDPIKNEKSWNKDILKNVITLNYGDSLQRGNRTNGKYPVYGSNGIVGNHDSYLIDYPTIVIGRKGSAGSVNLVKEPSFPIDTTFYTVIKKDLNIDFLFQYLKIYDLKKLSITTGVPGVNRDDIYKQKIILPPIESQNKFSQLSVNSRKILDDIQNSSKDVNTLFHNLLYRAFTGELTNKWREKNKEILNAEIAERKLTYGF